jgi:hypothetical protein
MIGLGLGKRYTIWEERVLWHEIFTLPRPSFVMIMKRNLCSGITIGLGMKPRTPECAADRIIENIESRSATGFSHREVKCTFILRGLVQLFDHVSAHRAGIGDVIKKHYGG